MSRKRLYVYSRPFKLQNENLDVHFNSASHFEILNRDNIEKCHENEKKFYLFRII